MATPYNGPPATLGVLIKYQHGLRAICLDCWHVESLDVMALSLRFGEAFPVPEIAAYLRCTGCASTRCSVQVTTSVKG